MDASIWALSDSSVRIQLQTHHVSARAAYTKFPRAQALSTYTMYHAVQYQSMIGKVPAREHDIAHSVKVDIII